MSLLKTLIGLSIFYSVSAASCSCNKPSANTCGINEEFTIDQYRCQETCEKYGNPTCSGDAPNGDCYCKKGYARLWDDGICTPTDNYLCTMQMPPTKELPNERLSEWAYDEPCGNTCENYKVPCHIMVPMVMLWSPHCVCKEGYSRLPNGKCVELNDPKCEKLWKPSIRQCKRRGDEVYQSQGSACQTTCDDLKSTVPPICILAIVEGCYCPPGKVRYVEGGECINIEDCP